MKTFERIGIFITQMTIFKHGNIVLQEELQLEDQDEMTLISMTLVGSSETEEAISGSLRSYNVAPGRRDKTRS
jgi:hypothetical protein